jgi:hypothetical protein
MTAAASDLLPGKPFIHSIVASFFIRKEKNDIKGAKTLARQVLHSYLIPS